jgi:FKBP-type peptidyl-prolyl cis-trans isomerase (trigger factor)
MPTYTPRIAHFFAPRWMISEEIRRRVKDLKGRLREEELRRGMAEEEKERARRETKESVARVVHAGEIRTVKGLGFRV